MNIPINEVYQIPAYRSFSILLFSRPNMKTVLVLAASLALVASSPDDKRGSCFRASRCCSGRDSSCFVTAGGSSSYDGVSSNEIDVSGGGSSTCFCDEGCLETGDCCHDYKEACAVKGERQRGIRTSPIDTWISKLQRRYRFELIPF